MHGDAQVTQGRPAVLDQDVLRFDVAVHDALGVHRREPVEEIEPDGNSRLHAQRPDFGGQLRERLNVQFGRHPRGSVRGRRRPQPRNDVRMPGKLLVQAAFGVELITLLIGAERVLPHLERDFPAGDAVPGTPDDGAAAAGDRRTDRDEVVRNGG